MSPDIQHWEFLTYVFSQIMIVAIFIHCPIKKTKILKVKLSF